MKNITVFLLAAGMLAAGTSSPAAPKGVSAGEYLTLTQESLPPLQAVIQAALDASDVETVPLHSMKKRARQSAWLPRLRIKMDYDLDAVDQWAFTPDARVYQPSGPTKQDRWERVGSDDRLSYGAYAEWDLSVFVWEKFDHQLAEKYAKQGGVKRRRIVEVSKRYTELQSLLPADASDSVGASDIADVLDNAIYLDAVTGYLLSATLIRIQEDEERAAMEAVMGSDIEVIDNTAAAEPEPAAEPAPAAEAAPEEAAEAAAPVAAPAAEEKADMLNFLNSL